MYKYNCNSSMSKTSVSFLQKGCPFLACYDRNALFSWKRKNEKYHALSCQNVFDALTFLLDNILFDLAPRCIDK